MLTAIVFLPAIAALAIALMARGDRQVRFASLLVVATVFVLTLVLWGLLDRHDAAPQFVQKHSWISAFSVQYFLGVDGLSTPLLALTGFLGVAAVLASWSIKERVKEYFVWLLVLETGILGVFTSLDLLMFFLFWEVELLPMYMLISIWGSGRKEYSAMKFLIFTLGGSALMLVGILVLFFSTGTFDMIELRDAQFSTVLISSQGVFFLLLAAFAVKLPIWPFHTWLPDAHTDAPTAVSIILAGVLLKMGGYGILRLCLSFFPDVALEYAWLLATLAVVNVLYAAMVVFRQRDLKRLIAYSSVSHMGFVLLGIASMERVGLTGASLQMFAHGTITGLLFLLVGLVYEKAHTRHIPDLGGLARRMPIIAVAFMVAGLASLGLPAMSGFAAELLVFLGSFAKYREATILATFGIVLTAGYILWMMQQVFFGPDKPRFSGVGDATAIEVVAVGGLVVAIVVVGIYPAFLTDYFRLGIEPISDLLGVAGG